MILKASLMCRISLLASLLASTVHGRRFGLLSGHSESGPDVKSHIPFRSNRPLSADYTALSTLASALLDLNPAAAFVAPGVTVRSPLRRSVPQMSISDELTGQRHTKTSKARHSSAQGLLQLWPRPIPSTRRTSSVTMGDDKDIDSIFGSDDSKDTSTERAPVSTFGISDIASELDDDNVGNVGGQDGKVVASLESGLVVFERFLGMSRVGYDVNIGREVRFGSGGRAVVVAQNAHSQPPHFTLVHLDGPKPEEGDFAFVQSTNLTGVGWDGDVASWSGICDFMGRPIDGAASEQQSMIDVFEPIIEIAERREVETPLITGVLALDALVPIGRGQSMLIVGPDELPEGSKRSDVSNSVVAGQMSEGGLRSLLVLTDPDAAKRQATITALKEAGVLGKTRVLEARTPQEAVIANHLACSIAQACGGEDIIVVIDNMRHFVDFWTEVEQTFDDIGRTFGKKPSDSERQFFGLFVERATARRLDEGKTGGTLTLLMNIPSEPKRIIAEEDMKSYTLEDFIEAKYAKPTLDRIQFLSEEKGIEITDDVLSKLKIPAPGANRVGWEATADTLISIVDGHVELQQGLAEDGIVPAFEASTSKQRVAIQAGKQLAWKGDKALQEFNKGLRMRLQYANEQSCRDKKLLTRAAGFKAIFQQPSLQPMTLGEELVLLFAAHNDLLEEKIEAVGAEAVRGIGPYILDSVKSQAGDMVLEATKTGLLDDKTRERFTTLISEAVKSAP